MNLKQQIINKKQFPIKEAIPKIIPSILFKLKINMHKVHTQLN